MSQLKEYRGFLIHPRALHDLIKTKPLLGEHYKRKITIVLMRGSKNIVVSKVSRHFEKEDTILWDEFDGAKRKSVFYYSHTTKRGRVYRERTVNITSSLF